MSRITMVDPRKVERANAEVIAAQLRKRGFTERSRINFGRPERRMANPHVAGVEEVINQPVYDSFSFAQAAAFAKTTIFQTPIGQAGKQLAQTNMVLAGQLQNPQKLWIRALRVFISNDTTIADVNNILRNVSVVLTIGKKPFFEGPVLLLQAGCGAVQYSAAQVGTAPAGSATPFSTSNGIADPRAVFTLSQPIPLESGETFSVTFNPEAAFNMQANTTNPAGAGTTIYCILDGELYRGVQ